MMAEEQRAKVAGEPKDVPAEVRHPGRSFEEAFEGSAIRRVFLTPDNATAVRPGIRQWSSKSPEPDSEASTCPSDETAVGPGSGPQLFDLTLDDLSEEEEEFFPEGLAAGS